MSAEPTPRTDALIHELFLIGSPEGSTPFMVMGQHARTLERELARERNIKLWNEEAGP